MSHWFWLGLTSAALLWYATITVYVAVRGGLDIRGMLGELRKNESKAEADTRSEQFGSKPSI